ncbi:MAG TPA: ferritin-like domain-containing protein [Methanocellaceae archaeon]
MASSKLLDLLNKAISRELQVSIQYMWQHVQWSGVKGYAVHEEFKSISKVEMKHAEQLAERIFYLGAKPTTKPEHIDIGDSLKEMIALDIKSEEVAIKLYKEIIVLAEKEGDFTTAHMARGILEQEEGHHDTFTTLAEAV